MKIACRDRFKSLSGPCIKWHYVYMTTTKKGREGSISQAFGSVRNHSPCTPEILNSAFLTRKREKSVRLSPDHEGSAKLPFNIIHSMSHYSQFHAHHFQSPKEVQMLILKRKSRAWSLHQTSRHHLLVPWAIVGVTWAFLKGWLLSKLPAGDITPSVSTTEPSPPI